MGSRWQLAQINVGTARYTPDDPRLDGFMSRIDEINALADGSPGFVWRLQDDSGNATGIDAGGGPYFLVNMSVWNSIEALSEFVYKTGHRGVMRKRRDWFEKPTEAYQALWWVPIGHMPTVEEGLERLRQLRGNGPGPAAFNFGTTFPPPEQAV